MLLAALVTPMPLSNIPILYQDADLLVVNKPTLLLSVPGRAEDNKDSVILRLQQHGYPEALIVHRLDWETTGVMLLARNPIAHRELSRQFQERITEKRYEALCWGSPDTDAGQIDLAMRYDPPNKPRQIIDLHLGKRALTFWRCLDRQANHCRMELVPYTGRSHQLRLHMQSLQHPILGDHLYAHSSAVDAHSRLCLHATDLSIVHPSSGKTLAFHSPAPF